MEYFLHIKPTFDCQIKVGSTISKLQTNKISSFLISQENDIFEFSIYPSEDDMSLSLPFSSTIFLSKKLLIQKNDSLDLIEFPNDNLLLIIKPFKQDTFKPFNIKSKEVSFGNISHTLYWNKNDNYMIRVENSKMQYIDIDYPCKITELFTRVANNELFIYAKTIKSTYVINVIKYLKKTYTSTILEEVDLLEYEKDKIITYKNLHNMFHHGKTTEYTFSPQFSTSSNLVVDSNENIVIKQKELLAFAFFDAVKVSDYDLARSYLTDELSNKLTDEHFIRFFGNFLFTHQNLSKESTSKEIALIYKVNGHKIAKIYEIELNEENKIENIIEQNNN